MKTYLSFFFLAFTSLFVYGQNVPIDFEDGGNGADWTWTTFENASNPALEISPNPDASGINTSATVAKFTALQAGAPFAGCESMHGADIGTFTLDASSSVITIMVWKTVISDVGIKLVAADNSSLGEIKVSNKLVNQWEELVFDFSSRVGITYDQIVIFPDFAARTSDNIIYFDNVFGGSTTSTSAAGLPAVNVALFPNPANNILTVQSDELIENYEVYSFTGQLLTQQKINSNRISIDVTPLPEGVFLLKATTSKGQTVIEKFHTTGHF
jgi:hypothetical protein